MNFSKRDRTAIARLRPDLNRRKVLLGLTAAGAVGVVGLPKGAKAQDAGVLRVVANANPSSLDPATGGAGTDHVFLYNMFDTLVDWDPATLAPLPGLANSFDFTDPQTLVLRLEEGVTFHDGTPFDAEAVKVNLDRNRSSDVSNIRTDLASVDSVDVTGPLEVTVRLNQPDTALPLILSDRAGMMVSPTALEASEEGRVDRSPVGTGPWKFVSWKDGERVIAEANDAYWKEGVPGTPRIEMRIIPDASTSLRAVQSGQADIAYGLSERQQTLIERTPNLTLVSGPTLFIYQVYMNPAIGPLKDVRVRKALSHAIDRDAFVLATQAGIGEPAYMNLPRAHWAYAPEAEQFTSYDPDLARKLLAEAGYPDGLELTMLSFPDQPTVQKQEFLLSQWQQIGVRGRFENGPIAESSIRFFAKGGGDLMLSAWTGRPDPSLTYSLLYSEKSFFNAGKLPPPDGFDQAMSESRATQDQAERAKALAKAQMLVMEHALTIPLSVRYAVDATSNTVENFKENLLGKPKFHEVTLSS